MVRSASTSEPADKALSRRFDTFYTASTGADNQRYPTTSPARKSKSLLRVPGCVVKISQTRRNREDAYASATYRASTMIGLDTRSAIEWRSL
jgi:hypothetical protein